MSLQYDFSPLLKEKLKKLYKKERSRYEFLMKKIEQTVLLDEQSIEHFKNLCYEMKHLKRVHNDKSFVLTFEFDKNKKHVFFVDFDHHDNIYNQ